MANHNLQTALSLSRFATKEIEGTARCLAEFGRGDYNPLAGNAECLSSAQHAITKTLVQVGRWLLPRGAKRECLVTTSRLFYPFLSRAKTGGLQ